MIFDRLGAYADAFRARRTLRRLPAMRDDEALNFARSYSWRTGHMRPGQSDEEILWLLARARALEPRVLVEIGTDVGGTLFLWTRIAAPDARLVAIDTRPLGRLGPLSPYALVRRGFKREHQRIDLLFGRDSHNPRTVAALKALLHGRPIDFLFIDGDHSYEGVKNDFQLYAPLVRDGGVVAFHDIAAADAPGVVSFWSEIVATHRTEQHIASSYGIGVVHMGVQPRTTA